MDISLIVNIAIDVYTINISHLSPAASWVKKLRDNYKFPTEEIMGAQSILPPNSPKMEIFSPKSCIFRSIFFSDKKTPTC